MSRRRNTQDDALFSGVAGAALGLLLLVNTDVSTNVAVSGISAAAISIPYVNPPPKNNADKKLVVTPTALFERLKWGDKLPHDLDLWTECYSLVNGQKSNLMTIGYLNKSYLWLDLSRDIQGGSLINEEELKSNAHASQVPPNTVCRFNVHLYHSHGGAMPLEGSLRVIQNKDSDDEIDLVNLKFTITTLGQELTIATITWDDRGNPIRDAIDLYPHADTVPIATNRGPGM